VAIIAHFGSVVEGMNPSDLILCTQWSAERRSRLRATKCTLSCEIGRSLPCWGQKKTYNKDKVLSYSP
jgi:hypothetical protein